MTLCGGGECSTHPAARRRASTPRFGRTTAGAGRRRGAMDLRRRRRTGRCRIGRLRPAELSPSRVATPGPACAAALDVETGASGMRWLSWGRQAETRTRHRRRCVHVHHTKGATHGGLPCCQGACIGQGYGISGDRPGAGHCDRLDRRRCGRGDVHEVDEVRSPASPRNQLEHAACKASHGAGVPKPSPAQPFLRTSPNLRGDACPTADSCCASPRPDPDRFSSSACCEVGGPGPVCACALRELGARAAAR